MKYSLDDLKHKLKQINGELYRNYKKLEGSYHSQSYSIHLSHLKGASDQKPAHIKIIVPSLHHGFPPNWSSDEEYQKALSDYLLRQFNLLIPKISKHKGSGKSGHIYVDKPGPQILKRDTIQVNTKGIELNFGYGLPGKGNRIDTQPLLDTIELGIPKILQEILTYDKKHHQALKKHIECHIDQNYIRNHLSERNLIAFIPNGAILPRQSSIDNTPLPDAIPFKSPDTLFTSWELPSGKTIQGAGIPKGITLISGGGYHGKTTLLNALKAGINNHIPGDGREYLVTPKETFKVNAEDGRYATVLNLSPFIKNLPGNTDSTQFSSRQCSGSTSQAATLIESLRMGTKVILLDEDSSASNFLAQDEIMQRLIGEKDRTISPLLDNIQSLWEKQGLSAIIVVGSSSQAFSKAHIILKTSSYHLQDVTKDLRDWIPVSENKLPHVSLEGLDTPRFIQGDHFRIKKRKNPFKTRIISPGKVEFGTIFLDFSQNEQLTEIGQTRLIHDFIIQIEEIIFKRRISLEAAVEKVFEEHLSSSSENNKSSERWRGHTEIRPIDLAFALNRFRLLKIKEK